jgi:integrase
MKLTALNVETWKPAATRQEVLDRDGLYFIVQPSGVKSWALRYRRKGDGKAVKHTIGTYPAITLKAARSMANELRGEIERGADPHGDKVVARRRTVEVNDSFEAVARRFVAEHQFRKNRSWEWAARRLGLVVDPEAIAERGAGPEAKTCPPLLVVRDGGRDTWGRRRISLVDRWGGRRLGNITRADVIAVLDEVAAHAPIMANRMHAVLARLFKWAEAKGISNTNPCSNIERAKEHSRDRVLEDKELRAVWIATGELGHPYAGIVRLLILTGQRRNEIADLRWDEIDLDERVLHLPAARTKNGRPHDVPLSAPALAIIDGLSRLVDADRVFTIQRKPVAGFSKMKERLDAASRVSDWTLHDIRRSVASGLQRLGVRLEVTEAVLNHRGGSMAGIVAVYQRHDYASEKRDALERWADHVEALVSGRKANVLTLKSAR